MFRSMVLVYAYLQRGEANAKPIVCLHGFPDTPHTFIYQFPVLLEAGYRLVVPFLRGYPPSQTGKGVDYYPTRLGEDLIEIIDQFCGGSAEVLGHDWGALSAYVAAQLDMTKITKMIVVAVPPFKVFETSFGDFAQIKRSRYALFFQLGPIANWWMRKNNCQGLDWLWSYWSPAWKYTEEDIQPLKDCLGQPQAMESATAYYRALVLRSFIDRSFMNLCMETIHVPTLLCQGSNDGCIGGEFFENADIAFEADYEKVVINNSGHFMHREQPEQFNQAMLKFLEGKESA